MCLKLNDIHKTHSQDVRSSERSAQHCEMSPEMDQISHHSSPLEQEPVLPTPPLPLSIPLNNPNRENSPPGNQAFSDFDEGDGSRYNSDEETPPLPNNLPPVTDELVVLPDIIQSLKFIQMLEDATLESQLSSEDLDTL